MIVIRRATPADVEGIAAVHVQSHRETYEPIFGGYSPISSTIAQRREQWIPALARGDAMFVADDDGRIVGFCHGRDSTMTTLYLLASHHRRGLGKRLMCELLTAMREAGVTEVTFNVLAANANAIAFYESQGARFIRREIVEDPEGPTKDAVFVISTAPQARGDR
jgi:phosphinothricin acetyltransferase